MHQLNEVNTVLQNAKACLSGFDRGSFDQKRFCDDVNYEKGTKCSYCSLSQIFFIKVFFSRVHLISNQWVEVVVVVFLLKGVSDEKEWNWIMALLLCWGPVGGGDGAHTSRPCGGPFSPLTWKCVKKQRERKTKMHSFAVLYHKRKFSRLSTHVW